MILKKWSVLMLGAVLVLGMSACSKKKTEGDGDVAGDGVGMEATDMGQLGAPIPELGAVYFGYDSFNLNSSSRAALDGHASWLQANSNRSVQIEGHCDERGTTEYNLALGERRASAVRDYLISRGVPAAQLSTISYGEERPANPGTGESAWSANRRAEFVSAGS